MRWLVSFAVALSLFAFTPHARADSNADLVEHLVRVIERAATISEANKNDCNSMGDSLSKLFEDNAALFAEIKARESTITAAERASLAQRFQARIQAAVHRLQPNVVACAQNPKVVDALKHLRAAF